MTITTLILLLTTGIVAVTEVDNCYFNNSQDVFKDGHTYIFLANNSHYFGRMSHNNIEFVEAEKTSINETCLFHASTLGNGKVAFQADNGMGSYVSRIYQGCCSQNIELLKIE